jgi:hypothetical protein
MSIDAAAALNHSLRGKFQCSAVLAAGWRQPSTLPKDRRLKDIACQMMMG